MKIMDSTLKLINMTDKDKIEMCCKRIHDIYYSPLYCYCLLQIDQECLKTIINCYNEKMRDYSDCEIKDIFSQELESFV